jgi:hypothetical protein
LFEECEVRRMCRFLGAGYKVMSDLSALSDTWPAKAPPFARGAQPAANRTATLNSAEIAPPIPSWQKPRLLPAANRTATLNSLKSPPPIPSWQKPRLLPAANRIATPNSAEIAAGDFSQSNNQA